SAGCAARAPPTVSPATALLRCGVLASGGAARAAAGVSIIPHPGRGARFPYTALFRSVEVGSGGTVSAGGSGTVTVQGTGGATSGGIDVGVLAFGSGSQGTSAGGNVSGTGQGGGSGPRGANLGVDVAGGRAASAGGRGT